MKKYTFSELNDIEFQDLVNDLLEKKLGIHIERFKPGKDKGIDGRTGIIKDIGIIQTKHYLGTGIAKLITTIKKDECTKVLKLKPNRYFFATSLPLSPNDKEKIIAAFDGVPLSSSDVFGNDEINALLREYPDIHRIYYKLWSDSTDSLELFTHPEIQTREKALLGRLNQVNVLFVETEDVEQALECLNRNHVVVLSGEPGVGKTTLAEYICQVYLKKEYRVHVIEGDLSSYPVNFADTNRKILLYYDDFLGASYFSAINGNQDSSIVRLIEQIKNEPNKRLILTSRTNIIQKAELFSQAYRSFGLVKQQYIIRINKYSRITKAKMLYNHLWHCSLSVEQKRQIIDNDFYNKVIDHRNFNPRLVVYALSPDGQKCSSLSQSIYEHLEKPEQIWDHCYSIQLDEQARILIKLCVASGGNIEERCFYEAYEKALTEYRFYPTSNQPTEFDYTVKLLCNSLLVRNVSESSIYYTTFNPSVSDYIILKINNAVEAKKLINALDNEKALLFYSDIIKSSKMRRSEGEIFANYVLQKYIDNQDCMFTHSLELSFYLELDNPKIIKAIRNFENMTTKPKSFMESYHLATLLEKSTQYGLSENKWIEVINNCDIIHNKLSDLYIALGEIDYVQAKKEIKAKIIDSLSSDIEEIIAETDGFNKCNGRYDIDEFAENCIDALTDDYPMLDTDDLQVLKDSYSWSSLEETLSDRKSNQDLSINVDRKEIPRLDKISEEQCINDMFRNIEELT